MKIELSQINEIYLKEIDEPNDVLCIKLLNHFEINIETAYFPCISIQESNGNFYLTIDD